jgi:hypothetical protein
MATKKPAAKKTTKTSKAKAAPKKTIAKKVTTAAKKPVKKTAKKTSPKKKKEMEVGASYECSICGLEVAVQNACDCDETCDLMCCGESMEII